MTVWYHKKKKGDLLVIRLVQNCNTCPIRSCIYNLLFYIFFFEIGNADVTTRASDAINN